MSNCGWVNRVLNWETNGLGCIHEGVIFGQFFSFFLNLPPKTSQLRLVWLGFFSKLPQNEFSFPG